jgi:hypothetical protein
LLIDEHGLEDEDPCAYVRYVRMSKEGFENVLEFIKDDIAGDSRNRRKISAAVRPYGKLYFLATDEVAMNDEHTFDALRLVTVAPFACLIMAIVFVVTFWYCGLLNVCIVE